MEGFVISVVVSICFLKYEGPYFQVLVWLYLQAANKRRLKHSCDFSHGYIIIDDHILPNILLKNLHKVYSEFAGLLLLEVSAQSGGAVSEAVESNG